MKIALLAFDRTRSLFLRGLASALTKRGHDVGWFLQHDAKDDERQVNWTGCDFENLFAFNPAVTLVFNGFAPEVSGGSYLLESRARVLFIERGWLPQAGHLYMDPVGLGARSLLSKTSPHAVPTPDELEEFKATLSKVYPVVPRPEGLPKEYILVPLQLEYDTSIRLDSPYFKTMESLVGFVSSAFHDFEIVIKPHPYNKEPALGKVRDNWRFSSLPMNTLAQHARAVVGINSTSLIESTVHDVSVGSLGNAVFTLGGPVLSPETMLLSPRSVLEFKPSYETRWGMLYGLSRHQFSQSEPGERALAEIERYARV